MENIDDILKHYKNKPIKNIYFFCGREGTEHISKCCKYNPNKDKWSYIPPTKNKRACLSDACVIAKDFIWVFGGNDDSDSYEIYNLKTTQWGKCSHIATGGGSSISATYDGKNVIYLVGGNKEQKTLDQIVKCTIIENKSSNEEPTLIFETFTQLLYPRYFCFTFIHQNQLFVVGGTNKYVGSIPDFEIVNNIEVVDLENKKSEVWFDQLDKNEDRVEGISFDGENIFILTKQNFYTININTKSRCGKLLEYPPIDQTGFGLTLSMGKLVSNDQDNLIFLIGTKETKEHFYYNIKKDKWFTSKSKRIIQSYFHGSVIEYEN